MGGEVKKQIQTRTTGTTLFLVSILLLAATCVVNAQPLTQSELQKLHPLFQLALDGKGSIYESQHLLRTASEPDLLDAIIHTNDAFALRSKGIHLNTASSKFATARLTLQQIRELTKISSVQFIDPGSVNYPTLDLSVPETQAHLVHAGFVGGVPYKGAGVIVVIYDTGIDWTHADFRRADDPAKSRILAIWDQNLFPLGNETSPVGLNYGVEYTQAHINDELDGTPTNFVRERDINGHGTHVASTAAGNGVASGGKYVGMAPEADIIVVKGGDASFSESRIIDGLTYAQNKSTQFGKPVVVNFSLGSQIGPHDGTRSYEVAIDLFAAQAGRVVVVSAGNDGGSPIVVSRLVQAGFTTNFEISIPPYTPTAGINNDQFYLDIWLRDSIGVFVKIISPGGAENTIEPNSTAKELNTSEGNLALSNYVSPLNGERNIQVYLRDAPTIPASGWWVVQLSGASKNVQADAWLALRSFGGQAATINGGSFAKTVAMPGTATDAITVGSYVTKPAWPTADGRFFGYIEGDRTSFSSTFSSVGPTRDGRLKPEISAPGQGITAALSQSLDPNSAGISPRVHAGLKYWLIEGTSMSAPHVTGAVALVLSAAPSFPGSHVKEYLTATADADDGTGALPNTVFGYGKLDIAEAMVKAKTGSGTLRREVLAYDLDGTNQIVELGSSRKFAVRFTPSVTGRVTGMQLNLMTPLNNPIQGTGPLQVEVFTNQTGSSGGIPGTKLGSTVTFPFSKLVAGTYNFISLLDVQVEVNAGTNYHIVLSVANTSDVLVVRTDEGGVANNRSSLFSGVQWKNFSDPTSGMIANANLRARVQVHSPSVPVSVSKLESVPEQFHLFQNYPNPFNPTSTIQFQLPVASRLVLKVFDVLGRHVTTLVDGEHESGRFKATWDGKDWHGVSVSSGVYFYRIEAGSFVDTKRMVLIR